MRENKYDDPNFFTLYSQMPRSSQGLSAAGEWREFRSLFPNLRHKRVLDLGCGFGWHCRYASEMGADHVVGIDISEKMLEVARKQTPQENVEYRHTPIEDAAFPPASFDVVVSSLALHYIASFTETVEKIHTFLRPGGDFVFSVEHPIFTAQGPQQWHHDAQGKIAHWPLDNYFSEGAREALFLGEKITKYHRTVATYLDGLLRAGFALTGIVEPTPSDELLASVPEMRDELRRPMMLLVSAKRG